MPSSVKAFFGSFLGTKKNNTIKRKKRNIKYRSLRARNERSNPTKFKRRHTTQSKTNTKQQPPSQHHSDAVGKRGRQHIEITSVKNRRSLGGDLGSELWF
ncbi:hypothetical protein [Sediminibacter sp. Hel_I_10]|uniref:hypothetical protein n=1 Tax=Sediminibacter sp. Hel_I_10 TaxID=1392490 RepID=UPI0012DE1751|nr:hypothetical protein [Sediminibacter sp. Hel_I_10]